MTEVRPVTIDCKKTHTLIPSYLDGELSEAQAGPLRRHLLSCSACRLDVQQEKTLQRWFVPSEAPAVPVGFAARVARRAFAGDTGEREGRTGPMPEGRLLGFVLQLTALAAAILLVLSFAIRSLERPASTHLRADDQPERLEDIEKTLEEYNRRGGFEETETNPR